MELTLSPRPGSREGQLRASYRSLEHFGQLAFLLSHRASDLKPALYRDARLLVGKAKRARPIGKFDQIHLRLVASGHGSFFTEPVPLQHTVEVLR